MSVPRAAGGQYITKKPSQMTNQLQSIASDLRNNILPKQHTKVNEVFKQRVENFLQLLQSQGEPNLNLVRALLQQVRKNSED